MVCVQLTILFVVIYAVFRTTLLQRVRHIFLNVLLNTFLNRVVTSYSKTNLILVFAVTFNDNALVLALEYMLALIAAVLTNQKQP